MIEPNCDMPWEIYLDWLQDQGNEDLREIDPYNLISVNYHILNNRDEDAGEGDAHSHTFYDLDGGVTRIFINSVGFCYGLYIGDSDQDGRCGLGDGCHLGRSGLGNGGEYD